MPATRFTQADRDKARELRRQGQTLAAIADQIGTSPQSIKRWCNPAAAQQVGARSRRVRADADSLGAVLDDLGYQLRFDRERGGLRAALPARIRSIADAERALRDGEAGAGEALRWSLVDIAACAVVAARDLDAGPAEDDEPAPEVVAA